MDISAEKLDLEGSGLGVRRVDHAVLDILRMSPGLGVPELIQQLGVTATAVRQRLDRLVDMKLVERRKQSVGRGRPSFNHYLTPMGWREVGATYADLAMAMWQELNLIPDENVKNTFLKSVADRMGKVYSEQIPDGSFKQKLDSLVQLLAERKIPVKLDVDGNLPVLEVQACPYPDLTGMPHDRNLCELEKQVISEALGEVMELSRCRLDGHNCCQFRPKGNSETEKAAAEIRQDKIDEEGSGPVSMS